MDNFDELETIKGDLSSCLILENSFDKFKRLGEIAKETDSSNIPEFLKKRIKDRIQEHQLNIVGILDFGCGIIDLETSGEKENTEIPKILK